MALAENPSLYSTDGRIHATLALRYNKWSVSGLVVKRQLRSFANCVMSS